MSYADDFARADGALGAPWLGGAGWAIISGAAVNDPALGADVVVNGGFDADANWTKGPGWSISAGVAVHIGEASDLAATVAPLNDGTWYRASYKYLSIAGGESALLLGGVVGMMQNGEYDTARREVIRAGGTGLTMRAFDNNGYAVDNVVVSPLALSGLLALLMWASPVMTLAVGVALAEDEVGFTDYAQGGVAGWWDDSTNPTSGLLAYHDGQRIHLDQCLAGTWSSLVSVSATYVAGAVVALTRSGAEFQLYYNGAPVGSRVTVSAGEIVNNCYHGLFATDSGVGLTNFALTTPPAPGRVSLAAELANSLAVSAVLPLAALSEDLPTVTLTEFPR